MPSLSDPLNAHALPRFTVPLKKVADLLAETQATALDTFPGQVIYQRGLRTTMFQLQALGRVYRRWNLDKPLFDSIRRESKILEDAIGFVDFWNVLAQKSIAWALPITVRQLAHDRYREACGRAWAWVEAQDWISSRYHTDEVILTELFQRKLKKVTWYTPGKEAKVLRKWLVRELRKIHRNIQALDLDELELGLHEARRAVRWISIYFSAMDGAFVLDASTPPPDHWGIYLSDDITQNPFNKLPAPEAHDKPLTIPAYLLYALSYLIDHLGRIKDKAQWTETVTHLLQLTGEQADLSAAMKDDFLEAQAACDQGKKLLDQVLVKDALLLRLADCLDK
ncbi:MAG TPA: hypothetical protein PKA06_11005 [Gemmatales bacterium]|nr:hypothetical protein [Gemmatales bacterium]HMP18177.1 hypothetical protein [Gemmatales bacterium]